MEQEHFTERFSSAPRYNTKAVVQETGIPADTFRAWERRYHVPVPHRTETGQRLYSERDIAIIRWLRDRTSEGLTISHAIQLLSAPAREHPIEDRPLSYEGLVQQLLQALLALQVSNADAVLGQAFAHYSLDDVCLEVIQPTLVHIGTGWANGTVSIGQEHFATHFIRRKLLALLSFYDIVEGQATIVAACVPRELHDLGLLVLAVMLLRRGYRVVYLGSDVPVHGLIPVVEQVHADLVCLSATTMGTATSLNEVAEALHKLAHPPIVVVGGQGSVSAAKEQLPYIYASADTKVAIDEIRTLIAERRIVRGRDSF